MPLFSVSFYSSETAQILTRKKIDPKDRPKLEEDLKKYIPENSPYARFITVEGIRGLREGLNYIFDDDDILYEKKAKLELTIKAIEGMLTFSKWDRISALTAYHIICGPNNSPKEETENSSLFPINLQNISDFISPNFSFLFPK